jgi:hypothetical protein
LRKFFKVVLLAAFVSSVSGCLPPLKLGRHTVVVQPTPAPNTVAITPTRVLMMDGDSVTFSAQINHPLPAPHARPSVSWELSGDGFGYRIFPSAEYAAILRHTGVDAEDTNGKKPLPESTFGPAVALKVQAVAFIGMPISEAQSQVYVLSTARAPITRENLTLIPGLRDSLGASDETLRAMSPAELVSQAEKAGWFVTEGVRREFAASVSPSAHSSGTLEAVAP